jgi:hypothetical protein
MPVKPRLFIGSSSEAIDFAQAIRSVLGPDLERTVWKTSFTLSTTTIESLINNLQTHDFAAFVFSPDDVVEIRGEIFLIARDNVLYELGLFTGHLGRERCFFTLPDNARVRLPSDLAGIVHGDYEAGRTDGNNQEAVSSFCSLVRRQTQLLGMSPPILPFKLIELAVQYEASEWIRKYKEDTADAERVNKKKEIFTLMTENLRQRPVGRLGLLKRSTPGFFMLLSSAIIGNPQVGDDNLVLSLLPKLIPRGFAQSAVIESLIRLQKSGKLSATTRSKLPNWLEQLQDVDTSLEPKLKELRDAIASPTT